jgi:hypothetical protein
MEGIMQNYGKVQLTEDEEYFFYFKVGIISQLTYATGQAAGQPWHQQEVK